MGGWWYEHWQKRQPPPLLAAVLKIIVIPYQSCNGETEATTRGAQNRSNAEL
jgi:hypothetical protein